MTIPFTKLQILDRDDNVVFGFTCHEGAAYLTPYSAHGCTWPSVRFVAVGCVHKTGTSSLNDCCAPNGARVFLDDEIVLNGFIYRTYEFSPLGGPLDIDGIYESTNYQPPLTLKWWQKLLRKVWSRQ